ncbi:MAG: hypothetical protein R6V40_04205, partial [Candidatus Moraniibacteriota bacterium]
KKMFRIVGFLLAVSLVTQSSAVHALSIPSSGEVMDDVEKRYGFDSNSLRRSQKKANYPEASIFFNKKEPKEGEKVTATASALNFKTSNENLFYTWFLVREEDDSDDDDVMEKAKRRAMGMVARGDFDPFLFNIDYSEGDSDPDDDAYTAPLGGATGRGGKPGGGYSGIGHFEEHCYSDKARRIVDPNCITRCYKHNFGINNPAGNDNYNTSKAGKDLIVECEHQFPEAPEGDSFENPANGEEIVCEDDYEIGDGEFTTNEEACWRLNPNSSDTDGDGFRDEEDLAGLGQQQFTWNYKKGDRIGVLVEGTSMIPTNEGDGKSATTYDSSDHNFNLEQGGDTKSSAVSGNSESSSSSSFNQEANFEINQGESSFDAGVASGDSGLNPYYKITWAGIGVCTDEKNENGDSMDDFFENDWCDNESEDLGYTYLATKPVYEKQEGNLNVKLSYDPKNPQADLDDDLYNTQINVEAGVDEEGVDEDLLYYKWDVYYCQEDNLESCTEDAESGENGAELLTDECTQNDVLGDCAEESLSSNFYSEGLALQDINFKVKEDFLNSKGVESDEKFYLKTFLRVKKNKSSDIVSVSSEDIPVVVNDTKIDFYKVEKMPDGLYETSDLVCGSGLYNKLCPVYPFQIMAARANLEDDYESYVWKINGEKVNAPLNAADCIFENGCAIGDVLYFPVLGSDKSVVNVSFKAQREEGENISTDRALSVSDPLAIIKSENDSKLWPRVVDDGSEDGKVSQKVFFATVGEKVEARADLVPSYVDYDDVNLTWYLNGSEVSEEFISENEDMEVTLSENNEKIGFNVLGNPGGGVNLDVEVEKVFSQEHIDDLEESWGVTGVKDLTTKKSILIRKTDQTNESDETAGKGTVKFFLASTYQNAPDYIVFLLRLSVSVVLFWFVLYGIFFLDNNKKEVSGLIKRNKKNLHD